MTSTGVSVSKISNRLLFVTCHTLDDKDVVAKRAWKKSWLAGENNLRSILDFPLYT